MTPTALAGGAVGGVVTRWIDPRVLRGIVIAVGLAVAVAFWV
jgi:uncharacterized membrane protein YfcA